MISRNRSPINTIFLTISAMGFFAILSSTMSKSPVLIHFATYLGTPQELIGIVAAASTIPGILVSLPVASLSDVFGRRKFLLIAGFVFASAPFFYLFVAVWWQLLLVRFYHGFATAIFVPVAEASIAELFPQKRAERISLFSSVTSVGRIIAPSLGGYVLFATLKDYRTLYLAVGVAGVTALIVAIAFLAELKQSSLTGANKEPRAVLKGLYQGWGTVATNRAALSVSFVQATQFYAFGVVEFFLAGYLPEVAHVDYVPTGIILSSMVFMTVIAKPWIGRISDKAGRRTPIIVGCLASGLPLLLVPFVTDFWILLALMIGYGLGFSAATSSTSALMSELVPQHLLGTSMGFLDTIMDVGQTLGPIVSGLIFATYLHYTGVFASLTLLLVSTASVFMLTRVGKSRIKEKQKRLPEHLAMKKQYAHIRIQPAHKTEHLLFNYLTFDFFRNSKYGNVLVLGNPPILTLLILAPYVLSMELLYFRGRHFFARIDEHIAGVMVLTSREDTFYVSSLAVAPKYRGLGIATCMLRFAQEEAQKHGKKWLKLSVLKANIPALKAYYKFGFVLDRERKRGVWLHKPLPIAQIATTSAGCGKS